MSKKPGHVQPPAIDRASKANVRELVQQIMAEKPKEPTLTEKVKEVLAK